MEKTAFEKGFEKAAAVLGRFMNPRVAANVAASAAASAKQEVKNVARGTKSVLQDAGEKVVQKSGDNVVHYDPRLHGYKAQVHTDGKYHG